MRTEVCARPKEVTLQLFLSYENFRMKAVSVNLAPHDHRCRRDFNGMSSLQLPFLPLVKSVYHQAVEHGQYEEIHLPGLSSL